MKLNSYNASLNEKMSEFDLWVTPSLGDIRDTIQFKDNIGKLKEGLDLLALITDDFSGIDKCSPLYLASSIIQFVKDNGTANSVDMIGIIFNVLLLATGKTDNNLKCQYPLFLRKIYNLDAYYQKNARGEWKRKKLSRTLPLEEVSKIIIDSFEKEEQMKIFSESYLTLILSDEQYANQLLALGKSYIYQKNIQNEDALLSSIVLFQSRGSITATQGHLPESILRSYMLDWGLKIDEDFNSQDVEIGEIIDDNQVDKKIKKRKYDFIIPFKTRKDGAKIFIQSQYYAGDSGSVSHKVVDQTDSTREITLAKYPEAVFIEYLDGAGYFSSLNGDLKKMLAKQTTKDFIQIRTAPLKLRRELQEIKFLTPLEIEHAILFSSGEIQAVSDLLVADGYSQSEVERGLKNAINCNYISISHENILILNPKRIQIIRRYCLLDLIANYGRPISVGETSGCLLVPGYKTLWGLPQAEVIKIALEKIPQLNDLWENKLSPFEDIQWLIDYKYINSK